MEKLAGVKDEISTVIGDDITFRGKVTFSNSLKIKGVFKGTILSKGKLVVEDSGDVEADIEVGTLVVHGSVKGNIHANEKVELKKPGKIIGDIKTPGFEMEIGSKFSGNCSM